MMSLAENPLLPSLLRDHLARGSSERAWRQHYSPQLTYGRHGGPARGDARRAAVALVLYRAASLWHVPLTVRPAELRTHGGQVSFPGGAVEADESSCAAAHRELVEELYADRTPRDVHVEWLGQLEPLFVFVSNVVVVPWVGHLLEPPEWSPQPAEVQNVISMSLRQLLHPPEEAPLIVTRGSLQFSAPRFVVEGQDVWGTTAVLLGELASRLNAIAVEETTR